MSWEALNWAGKQRTRAASTQVVLYVLANAADPDGVAFRWWDSPDHWWNYLVERTRLKRASLFKVLAELEEDGILRREFGATKGGARRPVMRLLGEEFVRKPEDDCTESTTETREMPRGALQGGPESTTETENQSTTETDGAADPGASLRPGPPGRQPSLYSTVDTSTPQTPLPITGAPRDHQRNQATSPSQVLGEPIGFNGWWTAYPDSDLMDRGAALREFVKLSEPDRAKAIERLTPYAAKILRLKMRPKSAHLWLRKRMFESQGPSVVATNQRAFVIEGSEAWRAWCNFFAVAYGGKPQIPGHRNAHGPRGQRGAWVSAEWPPGGELWLVPLEEWVVVEQWTPQYNRYAERVNEVLGRLPMLYRATTQDHRRQLIARNEGKWGDRSYSGLLVPRPWPPRKTEESRATPAGVAIGDLSDQDVDEFQQSA